MALVLFGAGEKLADKEHQSLRKLIVVLIRKNKTALFLNQGILQLFYVIVPSTLAKLHFSAVKPLLQT